MSGPSKSIGDEPPITSIPSPTPVPHRGPSATSRPLFISLQPAPIRDALFSPLAVVVPIYNEAAAIESVVSEWSARLDDLEIGHQFLLINDGSRDHTIGVLRSMEERNPHALIVIDKPNSGHGRTCRLGYDAAVASPCVEWILQIDSDGQCDPAHFKEFWESRNNADCVFGHRTRRDDGTLRSLVSVFCNMGATLLGGKNMVDPNVPYRLMRRAVLAEALKRIPTSFDLHNVAVTFVLKRHFHLRWIHLPIHFRDRQGGSSCYNLLNIFHMGVAMLLDLAKLRKPRDSDS